MTRVSHLAIVAGGQGTRLAAVAGDVPKVLVPIDGKPVLAHQLELAAASGIDGVTIYAGHLAGSIQAFAGDGSRFGVPVRIWIEGEPLGTAGAVLRSLDDLPEHFFVLYGDVLVDADLARLGAFHLDRRSDFTMLVQPTDHPHDSDLVAIDRDEQVLAIHACPHPPGHTRENVANAALYVVRRDALRHWPVTPAKQDFVRDVAAGLIA